MPTRQSFEQSLEELHLDLLKMAAYVENAIEDTIIALKTQDVELAKAIFDHDDLIDELERKIEKRCTILIARQQPLAKDLRTITATLKIITDLERIGDHASDIAEITIRMANEKYIKPLIDIPKMAEKAKQMVVDAIDAYVKQDLEQAKAVCAADDDVDELFYKIILEVIHIMKNDSQTVEQAINLMFIAKYLERMGDHATNIGEWVGYIVTGEHEHLARQLHKDDRKNNPFIS